MEKRYDPSPVSQEAELARLRQQVAELSWDTAFGMLTRAAFLRSCREAPPAPGWVVFLDLDDIRVLNRTYGYAGVDRRVRQVFQPLQEQGVTAARWYSGDEIVLVVPRSQDANAVVAALRLRAAAAGISFVDAIGAWEQGDGPIQPFIEALSMQACQRKPEQPGPGYPAHSAAHSATQSAGHSAGHAALQNVPVDSTPAVQHGG